MGVCPQRRRHGDSFRPLRFQSRGLKTTCRKRAPNYLGSSLNRTRSCAETLWVRWSLPPPITWFGEQSLEHMTSCGEWRTPPLPGEVGEHEPPPLRRMEILTPTHPPSQEPPCRVKPLKCDSLRPRSHRTRKQICTQPV